MPIKEITDITGFHAHVYFDEATRGAAEWLRDEIRPRFVLKLGRWHTQPVGPHPKPMYEASFAGAEFAAVVPWLMLNRSGLSILVHPNTDDPVADHEMNQLWLGEPLALDVDSEDALVETVCACGPSFGAVILDSIWTFRYFDLIQVMTHGGPASATEVLVTLVFRNSFEYFKFGYASAIAVVTFLILLMFTLLYVRILLAEEQR